MLITAETELFSCTPGDYEKMSRRWEKNFSQTLTHKFRPSKSSQSSWGNDYYIAARNWPHCLASGYWLWSKILKKDIPTHKSTPNYRINTVAHLPPDLLSSFSISGATSYTTHSRINVVLPRLCPTHTVRCRIEKIIHMVKPFGLLNYQTIYSQEFLSWIT